MARRINRTRRSINSSRSRIGRVTVQAVSPTTRAASPSTSSNTGNANRQDAGGTQRPRRATVQTASLSTNQTRRARRRGTVQAITAVRTRSAVAVRAARPVVAVTTTRVRVPLSKTIANIRVPLHVAMPLPRIRLQIPLILKPTPQKFSEDTLDISETKIQNDNFVPVERDGISSFVPEILQITDFQPIWNKHVIQKRYFQDFSPAGRLIDVQYNTLLLRRETLNNLLVNLAESRRTRTNRRSTQGRNQREINFQIDRFERNINTELQRTGRTINYYKQFIDSAETIKTLLDLKNIPKASFDRQYLTLEDFFQRRMQYNKEQYSIFSDTKIIQQLLADFKEIAENYSTNLLGLVDTDRVGDQSPVLLDTTYTLNDGFTFSIEQIRSTDASINATERSFFNTFLNSLPDNPDDRIKLLITVLSKEYRVSRGLGIPSIRKQLNDVFASGDTGSPFDNIIGVVGDNIFETPLGPESLLSMTTLTIDANTAVLPFERKYVDSDDLKKTYIPGSSFFIDSLLNVSNNQFNTKPYEEYANQFSRKFNTANGVINNLFSLARESAISPSTMNDRFLASFRNSIENLTNISTINRDQAIIAAIFKLANTDNNLKSKLFQYCLLVGLATNNQADLKPIFRQLAAELSTINNFSEVQVTRGTTPSLFGGLKTLRPFIERLASDIENRVLTLTTPVPKFTSGITLRANPQFTRLRIRTSQRTASVSAFSRLSVTALKANETTINIDRFVIRRVLLSNIDPRSSSVSNFIREYVNLANDFAQAAAFNGEQKYLLPDLSGRTRYNFLSTSTQLLILFETLSSYVAKYSFATFSRSPSIFNSLITIDASKNEFIQDTIDDLIGEKSVSVIASSALTTRLARAVPSVVYSRNATATNPVVRPVSAFSSLLRPTRSTVKRSGNSTKSSSKTMLTSGILSRARNSTERTLLQTNLSSAFLGTQALKRIGVTKFNPIFFKRISVNLRNTLIAIRNKVGTEDAIIGNILNILQALERRVREAKTRMLNIYNTRTLNAFLSENTLADLEIVKHPAQVRAAAFSIENFTNRTRNFGRIGQSNFTWFLDTEIVQPETRTVLYSLLSENEYLLQNQADKRIKIISVGIPAGFSRQLSDRIKQSAINADTFKTKQIDVVSINVYKRDQRFDDIVFKPKTYLFDLSMFQDEDRINVTQPRENERFDSILNRVSVQDYENINSPRPTTYLDIARNEKYNFLTNDQKRSIIKNHTISSLFELYLRLLTGMRIEEESFPVNDIDPGTSLDQEFVDIVYSYIKDVLDIDIPNLPIMEVITDPEVDDEAKDILRLFVFGDIVFEPQRLRNQVTSPKLFDRIFHVPVNSEEFEIDEDLTRETESGKLALEQSFVQVRLVRRGNKLFFRPKDRNELIFEDYFVTIENAV